VPVAKRRRKGCLVCCGRGLCLKAARHRLTVCHRTALEASAWARARAEGTTAARERPPASLRAVPEAVRVHAVCERPRPDRRTAVCSPDLARDLVSRPRRTRTVLEHPSRCPYAWGEKPGFSAGIP
jgi:hypothetical protein